MKNGRRQSIPALPAHRQFERRVSVKISRELARLRPPANLVSRKPAGGDGATRPACCTRENGSRVDPKRKTRTHEGRACEGVGNCSLRSAPPLGTRSVHRSSVAHCIQQGAPPPDRKGPLIMVFSAYAGGYAGSSTGRAGSPPFFSQRSSLAMAKETEWATVA